MEDISRESLHTEEVYINAAALNLEVVLNFELSTAEKEKLDHMTAFGAAFQSFTAAISTEPHVFIVNDEHTLERHTEQTALSWFVGAHAQCLSRRFPRGEQICLTFFCGVQNVNAPAILMRSLTAQLLHVFRRCGLPIPMDPDAVRTALETTDLKSVCLCFLALFQGLRGQTVWVMVDGLYWYDNHEFVEDMKLVMGFLNTVGLDERMQSRNVVVKLLITNVTPEQRFDFDLAAEVVHFDRL
ncbi:hypothetical protein S7711_11254 [Stachybotrys chartarum IBT 7711]|uniref:Uncharacterized protein n=1 Tax=Stachybotrys chartarum (strain CBS 109288 / IBT 7711) TaxID=1280523 RepID=A0A084AVL1_STACB|nr:hypothetical protein S7711_11254 [Stachybotrys chartarum IBT 7711]